MPKYLIAFNNEWVPEHTPDQLRAKSEASRAVLDDMKEAVQLGGGRVQFEASGGVNLDTVAGIAATGVDFISVGALTHSARAIDFSLELHS